MTEQHTFDQSTYDIVKNYLKAAMEHVIASGRSVREFTEFALEKFGDGVLPYLQKFMEEVQEGRIKIEGLTKSALATLSGQHVSSQQREAMIRDAAYFRAQQRGFTGGSADEDWQEATRQVDAQIAAEGGLIGKGKQLLTSITDVVEKEIDDIRDVVTNWFESRHEGEQTPSAEAPEAQEKEKEKTD
ncbi:MAG: DUF2934 domain-containing protein [Gammaproteobacteria bacterium]